MSDPTRRRRWLQFSLRTFLILVAVSALWLGITIRQARARKAAHEAIDAYGGSTATYQVGPQWMGRLLDDERSFHDACRVTLGVMGPKYDSSHPFTDDDLAKMIPHLNAFRHFNQLDLTGSAVSDAGLAQLKRLSRLKILSLGVTKVSDAGLKELQGLGNLEELNLVNTQVTPAGVEQLRRVLPNCTIEY